MRRWDAADAEVASRFGSDGIDDCGLLMLQFENGVMASHDPSWSRCKSFPTWGDVTLEIVGAEGITRVDAMARHRGGIGRLRIGARPSAAQRGQAVGRSRGPGDI